MRLPDLTRRTLEPELMDDPGIDPGAHHRALTALARVNRVSGTADRIWRCLRRLPRRSGPLRVLDVACGGGDVLLALARRARREGLPVELHGGDRSEQALAWARVRAEEAGVRLHLHRLDVLEESLPQGFDLVSATLFLHHLEDDAAAAFLARAAGAGERLLVQDLRRTRAGYLLAWWGLRILSSSRVARVDGPLSVRAGFTLDEARHLAGAAGLHGARVRRAWPQRFVLSWVAP